MKRAVLRSVLRRGVSAALAFSLLASVGLSNVSMALAADETPTPPVTQAPSSSVESSPTVVRELEESRTADSATYLMSDGSYSAHICTQPIHYADAAGVWQQLQRYRAGGQEID